MTHPPGRRQLIIVGGGPAAFFAAIHAAERRPSARAVILEKGPQVLAKVRVSGGGRCNLTCACFDPARLAGHYPRGGRELRGPLTRFGPRQTMDWFESHGVRLKAEADGRVFPASDRAETIVAALLAAAAGCGVEVRTATGVESIAPASGGSPAGGFCLTLNSGPPLDAGRVLLATGGEAEGMALAASLGHTIVQPVPSLFAFRVGGEVLGGLAGLVVDDAELSLPQADHRQRGRLLVTHDGLSGPAALALSAWAARDLHACGYQAELRINWRADLDETALRTALTDARSRQPRRQVASACPVGLPLRLWRRLVEAAGVEAARRWADLSNRQMHEVAGQVRRMSVRIDGRAPFKDEFVTCGGVKLSEVNMATMESRLCPGLFLAGEILDIDGLTGGFNLQNAWTTGALAGAALAEDESSPPTGRRP